MEKPIRILLPIFLVNTAEIYFTGYVYQTKHNGTTIYITRYSTNNEILRQSRGKYHDNMIHGKCGNIQTITKHEYNKFTNIIFFSGPLNPKVEYLLLNGSKVNVKNSDCLVMIYEYDKMRDSQMINETADNFFKLHTLILVETGTYRENISYESEQASPKWLEFSMFLLYIYNYYKLIKWLIISVGREKKVSVKQGNLLMAIILDLTLGYLLLQLLSQGKDINTLLVDILERLINLLHSLLKWIMGAPAGLKLNNAFNKMLGKYFSYHVQLWWLFLDVSGEKLDVILHIYRFVGYLGFTLQTAIISDMICIATFHSYCIYVYAARLFNLQISGIVALLRLFVGRKYNPLRGSIDSCEYTNQELFVGTVAFTILLLLLPTTTMYYIVFTVFRVFSLTVQYTLAKLIYIVQTLPLYVMPLWILHSPKIAGNIRLKVANSSPFVLEVKLLRKSLCELVSTFKPPVEVLRQVEWTNLFSNIFVGRQLV